MANEIDAHSDAQAAGFSIHRQADELSMKVPGESLDQIIEHDRENLAGFRQMYGPAINLADDVARLYSLLTRLAAGQLRELTQAAILIVELIQDAAFALTKSTILILEGHLCTSAALTRRAVEGCGICTLVSKDPALAEVWMSAHSSDREVRKKFRASDMFQASDPDPLTRELARAFYQTSRMAHVSIISCSRRFTINQKDGRLSVAYRSNDLVRGERSQPIGTYLWTLSIHLRVLKRFAALCGIVTVEWNQECGYVSGKLGRFAEKHRADIHSVDQFIHAQKRERALKP